MEKRRLVSDLNTLVETLKARKEELETQVSESMKLGKDKLLVGAYLAKLKKEAKRLRDDLCGFERILKRLDKECEAKSATVKFQMTALLDGSNAARAKLEQKILKKYEEVAALRDREREIIKQRGSVAQAVVLIKDNLRRVGEIEEEFRIESAEFTAIEAQAPEGYQVPQVEDTLKKLGSALEVKRNELVSITDGPNNWSELDSEQKLSDSIQQLQDDATKQQAAAREHIGEINARIASKDEKVVALSRQFKAIQDAYFQASQPEA